MTDIDNSILFSVDYYFFFFYSSCFTIMRIDFVHLFCIIKLTCMLNLQDEIQSIHVNYMIVKKYLLKFKNICS